MWQLIGLFQSIGWWKAHRRDGNFSLNGSVIKISKIRHIIWQEKYEQNLPSNWKNKINMSKTCHQIATIAHIWAQLVIKISKIYGSNLPSNWHNMTYMSIFFWFEGQSLYTRLQLSLIPISSVAWEHQCFWHRRRRRSALEPVQVRTVEESFFYTSISWPILVVKCYFRLLGVL